MGKALGSAAETSAGGPTKRTEAKRRETMETQLTERITRNPNYQLLRSKRSRFGWTLTLVMLVVYYGYILLIAFSPDLLAIPIGDGVTTWGIPIGFGVIVFTIAITAFYVQRANSEFDELSEKVKREALK
jgi:uncharacterized membrane protein (DUF485 family)